MVVAMTPLRPRAPVASAGSPVGGIAQRERRSRTLALASGGASGLWSGMA